MSRHIKEPNKRARRAGVALAIVAVLASGVYFARQSGTNPQKYENDFNVFYFAASEVLDGRDPYQEVLHAWTPYLYPPVLAELMMPMALLSLPAAAYLWFLINLAAAVAAARMAAALSDIEQVDGSTPSRASRPRFRANETNRFVTWITERVNHRSLIAWLVGIILLRFILDNFKLGQVNLIIAMLAVAHVYCYATNRRRWAAAAIALAIAIKLTPALLLVYHLARRRWLYATACGLCAGALIAVSFLPFGARASETFGVFFNRTVRNQQGFDLAYGGNQSLRGFVARLTTDSTTIEHPQVSETPTDGSVREPSSRLTLALAAILLAVAVGAAVLARTDMAAAAPFFALMVMLSPLSWKAHFVILILPVAFIAGRALYESSQGRKRLLVAVLIVLFVLSNLTSRNLFGDGFAAWCDVRSLVLAAAFVAYVTAVWQGAWQFVNLKRSGQSEMTYDHQSAQ
ncbi:MAG: glycosyltransferase family 87 protein [Blastocatellia bacterium]